MPDFNDFKRYFPPFILTLAAILTVSLFRISIPFEITTTTRTSEMAVVGEGKIEAIPDTAYVDAGITVTNEPTVADAQKKIDNINNNIIEALSGLGIKKTDIKTSNYGINPNYSYDSKNNQISGYNGNVTLSIKVTEIGSVSSVIEQVTRAGANQIQGARFAINDPGKFREEARNKAIQNAREQAQKMSQSLGIRLGRVVNVVESSPGQISYPAMEKMSFPMSGGGGADIEPGSQTISSVVTLYFEKK